MKMYASTGSAGPLGDLDHRSDVGRNRAPGASRHDAQARRARSPWHMRTTSSNARCELPGRPTFMRVDPDVVRQVQELDLRLDGGIGDARVLEPIAQRLVEERDPLGEQAAVSPTSFQS